MTDLTLRTGRAEDAALLTELGRKTFYDTFAVDGALDEIENHMRRVFGLAQQSAELDDANVTFLIAEIAGEAIGYSKALIENPPDHPDITNALHLERIYVREDWIGKKVGAALMQGCLDLAAEKGRDTIWLGVWDQNLRAIAFYEKWGFRQSGVIEYMYGNRIDHDMLMVRPVVPPES